MKLPAWAAAAATALLLPSALAQNVNVDDITKIVGDVSGTVDDVLKGLPNVSFTSSQDPTRLTTPPAGSALWTETVFYCATKPTIAVNAFDMTLWKHNQSLTFGFSFASLAENLELEANLYLTAYDMSVKNVTINLCEVLPFNLCQLSVPRFNLTGFGDYKLPDGYLGDIPDIAWKVPDLDVHARMEIIDKSKGVVGTCLQARLTNGWTVDNKIAKWATGMFTLLSFILALLQSLRKRSSSPALFRWFDVLSLYQNAAATGLMALNYPFVWVAFTRNFAWALALIWDGAMQNTINKMRRSTGGTHMPFTTYEDFPSINRTLIGNTTNNGIDLNDWLGNGLTGLMNLIKEQNPQISKAIDVALKLGANVTKDIDLSKVDWSKVPDNIDINSINLNDFNLDGIDLNNIDLNTIDLSKLANLKRAVIPDAESQLGAMTLGAGLPTYVNGEKIPVANAYSTVFFWMLAFLAILIALHVVIAVFMLLLSLLRSKAPKWIVHLRRTWFQFCAANFFRFCLGWTFPIVIFSFYQWKIGRDDATGPIVLGVIGWLVVILPLVVVVIVQWSKNRKQSLINPNVSRLWTDYRFFHAAGVLYRYYRVKEHFFWFMPLVLGMIAKAGFISFGGHNQWAQVIGCMVVEFLTLLIILIFRPYRGIWNGILGFILCLFRFATYGCLIAYIDSVNVKAIPRTVVGVVQIALIAIPTLLLLIDMIWTFLYDLFHFRRRKDDYADLESPYYDETGEKDPSALRQTLVANDSLRDTRLSDPSLVAQEKTMSPNSNVHDPFQPPRPFDQNHEQTPLTPQLYDHYNDPYSNTQYSYANDDPAYNHGHGHGHGNTRYSTNAY